MSEALLAHRLEGEGETVLLLNGGMMTYAAWDPVSSRLRERYRILLCDLRGQLQSPGEAHRELAANLPDLIRLLDHHGLEKVHVLGTSFGGQIGLLLAAERPERVRSLIAVTVSDYTTPPMERGARRLRELLGEISAGGDPGRLHDLLVEEVYSDRYVGANRDNLTARRGQVAALPRVWFEGLDGIVASVETFDLRDRLDAILCPTLVVVASHDLVMPPERGRALAAAIPGGETAEHPSSGHALVAEDPEWLADRCLAFLDRVRDRTPRGGTE